MQGTWRTFDRVVDGIVANLIAPNAPCDVVLALDWMRDEDTREVLAKLRPHVVAVLYPSDSRREGPELDHAREFSQVQRALDYVNVSAYAYIAKTRTDLAVMVPFDFATAVGRSARFPDAFARFVADLRATAAPPVRPCEALSIWVYSFGLRAYVKDARRVMTRRMVWCPVTNAAITRGLLRALRDACAAGWGGDALDGNAASDAAGWAFLADAPAVADVVSALFADHHIMLLAGSTWLNWGASEDFLRVHKTIAARFGELDWKALPPPWEELSDPTWRRQPTVTESHMRLSHLVSGVSLVDVYAQPDYEFSFARNFPLHCRTWGQLQGDPLAATAGVFLMRDAGWTGPAACASWWPAGGDAMVGVWSRSHSANPSTTPSPSPTPSLGVPSSTPSSAPRGEALQPPPPSPTLPPLRSPWTAHTSETTGRAYYHNADTEESTYTRPV